MKGNKRKLVASVVGAMSALLVGEAYAAEKLEEIVVTARQRAESVQDIPIVVTAFSEADFEKKAMLGLEDVARFTPALNFEDFGGGFGTPVIRSAAQTQLTQIEQNVATFWDGIYVPRGWAVNTGMSGISRIEVVKGPQSARYGRNAFMGAINYVPRKPTDEFEMELEGTLGIDERIDYGGYISGPIIEDRLSGLFSYNSTEFDGSWDNTHPNAGLGLNKGTEDNAGGWDNESFSLALNLRATDTLSFNASYYDFDFDEENRGATQLTEFNGDTNCGSLGPFGVPRLFCGEIPSPPDKIAVDPRAYGRQAQVEMFRLGFDWQISDAFELTYFYGDIEGEVDIASMSESDNVNCGTSLSVLFNGPGCSFQNTPLGGIDYDQHEARLTFNNGGKLTWTVGTFYSDGDDQTLFAIPYLPVLGTEQLTQEPLIGDDSTLTEVTAYFAEVIYRVNDQLSLSFEGRYSDEEKTSIDNTSGATFNDTFKNFIPRVNLEYALNDEQLLYASIAQGVKAGGFSPAAVREEDRVYDEEENWTYEIGSKNVLLGGDLIVNAALFYIEWSDIQLNSPDFGSEDPNALNIISNLGDAKSYGVELDAIWQMTDNFTLNAATSYVDATYDDGSIDNRFARLSSPVLGFFGFGGPTPSCDGTTCPTDGSIGGNEVERQAPFQLTVGAEWASQVSAFGGLDAYVRADVAYQSEREAESMNLAQIEARTITNATAGVGRESWDLRFWVRNLTDEKYVTNSFTVLLSFGNGYGTIFGERRTAGLTATYRF